MRFTELPGDEDEYRLTTDDDGYRLVGCPEHGRMAIRPLSGSWECDDDAILHHGHALYRCAMCDRSFDHDISGPDVQWIIHQGR